MRDRPQTQMALRPPGRVLRTVLIGLFLFWLVFALGINWGGVSGQSFLWLAGNLRMTAEGEIWRLATPLLLHDTGSIGHILGTLLGLYFLGAPLEDEWGAKRFARFLAAAGTMAYAVQFLFAQFLSPELSAKLIPEIYFGAMPVVEAVAIAWACSFKGKTVLLFFVLPVSSRGLILLVVGVSLMSLIAGTAPPSGHLALFAGMGAGWFLGGGTPSPFRKMVLKFRLGALEREAEAERKARKRRAERSGFKVIEGGGEGGEKTGKSGTGPDGNLLN